MLAWGVGLGVLVKREYFKSGAALLAEGAARVGPGASYYSLSMGGGPIGYASSTIDTTPTGIEIQNTMVLDIATLGRIQRTALNTMISLTRDLRLVSFLAILNSEAARFTARGTVDGDSVLSVEIETGGGRPERRRVRLDRPLVMDALLPLRLAFGGQLEVGRSYTINLFDPLLMQERAVAVRVLAESTFVLPDSAARDPATGRWVPARYDTVHAWRIGQEYAGIGVESWIDDQGHVVSAVSPIGFRMDRTAFEIAVENWRRIRGTAAYAAGPGPDIIASTAIASNASLDAEALEELRVRLGNVRLAGFDLSGGRQRLLGDTLVVHRERGVGDRPGPPPPLYGARLPMPAADSALRAALTAELLVQSDDPRIQAQARRIVGRERRAGRVAELLSRWVHDNVEKAVAVTVPSAIQVLEERSGDCNEHTVLYVALARALGLPARTAAGVVYLRGRFYYHAWPEVWLGEWVAVDPTFGQFPADAAHLRFVIGGLARQVELIRLIGRLQLEVVQ